MNVQQKTKGFTIIEVVLVLAIAGLIFLIVFLALPALQRTQRDTQRRSDVGRALAAVQSYQSNKNGSLPVNDAGTVNTAPGNAFISAYLTNGGSTFADPSGSNYSFVKDTAPTNVTSGALGWYNGRVCGTGATPTTTGAGARNVAIVILLENGGTYCQNN
jgi:prepilin-type N-terminal cleavage/methylation domain-containing protein